MRFPRHFVVILLAFGAVLVVSGAEARQPNPTIEPATESAAQKVYPRGYVSGGNVCTTGPYQSSYPFQTNYLAPPEAIATLLKATDCAACMGGMDTLQAVAAHIYANFVVACDLPIKVSIVGASDSSGCWLPDTNRVLCPGVFTTLGSNSTGLKDVVVAMPGTCRWNGPAYLMVTFLGTSAPCDTANRMPRLPITASCTTCHGWDYFLDARVEMCSAEELNGRPAMYMDVASCVVPVTRRSWGTLKSYYRP